MTKPKFKLLSYVVNVKSLDLKFTSIQTYPYLIKASIQGAKAMPWPLQL